MYEKLVKALREHANKMCVSFKGAHACGSNLTLQAADAIEELEQTAEHYKGCSDDWYREACDYKAMLPRWIPVTERLPEEEKEVYWCYTNMGIMCECRWTNNRYGLGESDAWGWNIMDVPQYQRVTHWMPLPEPPKEET